MLKKYRNIILLLTVFLIISYLTYKDKDSNIPELNEKNLISNQETNNSSNQNKNEVKSEDTTEERLPTTEVKPEDTAEKKLPETEAKSEDTTEEKLPIAEVKSEDTTEEKLPETEAKSEDTTEEKLPASEAKSEDTTEEKTIYDGSVSKEQVRNIVKEYLIENPEIIGEALEKLHHITQLKENEKRKEILSKEGSEIYSSSEIPVLGNPDSKNIVVMFFDYNCGYCKESIKVLNKLAEEKVDVKIILKNLPILGESSTYLAKMAIAVNKVNSSKFFDVSNKILNSKISSKVDFEKILIDNDLEVGTLTTIANSTEIDDILNTNQKLASDLGISGVPAFIINGNFFPGYLSYNQILSFIDKK